MLICYMYVFMCSCQASRGGRDQRSRLPAEPCGWGEDIVFFKRLHFLSFSYLALWFNFMLLSAHLTGCNSSFSVK